VQEKKGKRLIRESCTSKTNTYSSTNTRVLLDSSHLLGLEYVVESEESECNKEKEGLRVKGALCA